MNKTDRRVRRTKKLLKDALAKLLLEKDINSISVSELTTLADISRGAFYTHYQDIYDLYESLENDFIADMSSIIVEGSPNEYYDQYEKVIDYVRENADICRVFMDGTRCREKMTAILEERYTAIVLYEMHTNELKEDWKYLIRYHNEGFMAALRLWADNDFAFPKEKLLKMVMDIDKVCDPLFE